MIQLKNVSKSFEGTDAIHRVYITVQKGSIYGLLGSNGAGKTTILKILAGIMKQNHGQVLIKDEPVFENPSIKERVFFIPDYPYFFHQYTVKQMADFYKSIYRHWSESRFSELANVFEMDINKKIHKFSKGVQRQIAFWLALSTMPEILILDEPMDGLDPVIRKKVKSLIIQDVADREMTVLISSHNLREVEDICDHVGILHKGSLLLEKELDDLKTDIHKIQIAFKNDVPKGLFRDISVLHKEKRGSVLLCIVRGSEEDIVSHIEKFSPVIFDLLPLTLEEIFIYEMGDAGYAIKNILV
ncbi:ABC transporter ATP-binding protein [Bacillus methanolicus PB1]|uniref:ABC transporter ATP-binding protein n=1 Tax=Bacillus methanolicus PB1 TaxID=997296 RepID=I3DVE5_BACMT|nr:ABC transporter ATP-binding protein [Bacillus methanolicus]EIJ78216.1 ABC transporter ATP-binding protein [Bacillus methanolicus PB1]